MQVESLPEGLAMLFERSVSHNLPEGLSDVRSYARTVMEVSPKMPSPLLSPSCALGFSPAETYILNSSLCRFFFLSQVILAHSSGLTEDDIMDALALGSDSRSLPSLSSILRFVRWAVRVLPRGQLPCYRIANEAVRVWLTDYENGLGCSITRGHALLAAR